MNTRERRRLTEFSRVKDGLISVAEAARVLGLSERQARRLWQRYRQRGDAGLIHGLRGKKSNASKAGLRQRVLDSYRRKYAGLNAAHAAEKLGRDQQPVLRQTLWRWLKAENLIVQPRRCRKHRQRRQRRPCVGELLQMDGSTHPWFGPAHRPCVLFVMVDDASGEVFARFYAREDTAAAFDLFGRYVKGHGLPAGLYVDHDSIYVVNDPRAREKARQAGKKPPLTQFGRAMAEVGVRIIAAGSPQAKGRVERMNRTLQDRLLKELALATGGRGIHDVDRANAFLEQKFLPAFNRRFGQPPASGINLHRALPRGLKLEEVLCQKEPRVVGQDWCVRFANRILQIAPRHEGLGLAGKAVEVWQWPEGTLQLRHRGGKLIFSEVATRPVKMPAPALAVSGTPWRPAPNHPWRSDGLPVRVSASAPLQSASLRSASFRSADAETRVQV